MCVCNMFNKVLTYLFDCSSVCRLSSVTFVRPTVTVIWQELEKQWNFLILVFCSICYPSTAASPATSKYPEYCKFVQCLFPSRCHNNRLRNYSEGLSRLITISCNHFGATYRPSYVIEVIRLYHFIIYSFVWCKWKYSKPMLTPMANTCFVEIPILTQSTHWYGDIASSEIGLGENGQQPDGLPESIMPIWAL